MINMLQLNDIDDENDDFNFIENTLLYSLFTKQEDNIRNKEGLNLIERSKCLIMPSISNLYIYTNPPPVGYGSPGPKVAESILRAEGYNRKRELRERRIGPFEVNCGFWEHEEEDYPFDQITGNWHPGEAYNMLREFKIKYHSEIQVCAERTLDHMLNENATVLTTGRQTWNPVQFSSNPSPTAYIDMMTLLKKNNESDNHSLFTLTQILHSKKASFVMAKFRYDLKKKRIYDKTKSQYHVKCLKRKVRQWVRIDGIDKASEERIIMASTFCSYIKHGERGKLKRRAIASPNIILRAYFNIIEHFHLELGKMLPGTTISIGGDEKKQKIMKQVNTVSGMSRKFMFTATQDATKFNECMNSDLFAMMHLVLFNHELTGQSETEEILCKIFTEGNFLLAQKRITLGSGPNCFNESKTAHNNPDYNIDNLLRFNEETRKWIQGLSGRFTDGYIKALPGMLMGMHNAAATTLSYIAEGYRQSPGSVFYKTLRSSDDSLSVVSAETASDLIEAINTEYRCLKMLGVNIAESKSYWIQGVLGEYNSWYIDEGFSAQYGTETSALRPQGNNPGDDFNTCALTTSSAMSQLCINPIGAQMRLLISISHTRRLWRIERTVSSRSSLHVFLADGGMSPWTAMSCGLDETTLREHFADSPEKKNYWKRCLNPNNPFSKEASEEFTFSKEKGTMALAIVETPRTIFHYTQRHNRTFRGEKADKSKNNMKFASEALDIIELANPAFKVITYQSTQKCLNYAMGAIDTYLRANREELTMEEIELISRAVRKVENTNEEEEFEDNSDHDLDL